MSDRYSNRKQIEHHRTLFVSDLHLGARCSEAQDILDFLKSCRAETVYLVGDIFDLWHVGKVHWSSVHNEIVAELNRFSNDGARLIYLVGNHDRLAEDTVRKYLPEAEFCETVLHEAADNKTYLVLHGDQADRRFLRWHVMTLLGSRLDALLRGLDNRITRGRDNSQKKVFKRLIDLFNGMMAMGERFETLLIATAKEAGANGVICGHSHRPVVRMHGDMTYANCGDWVDSLTALTEDQNGRIELHRWRSEPAGSQDAPSSEPFRPAFGNGQRQGA
ncbi:MAG: UDP-2,3-diacylglucosamine diphosphatase [Pseudomonadota bacterium]|nr:UDP-2,3-diacylglucosamine diphosphatase [Pseudomonadota bacterium]